MVPQVMAVWLCKLLYLDKLEFHLHWCLILKIKYLTVNFLELLPHFIKLNILIKSNFKLIYSH